MHLISDLTLLWSFNMPEIISYPIGNSKSSSVTPFSPSSRLASLKSLKTSHQFMQTPKLAFKCFRHAQTIDNMQS